MHIYYFLSYLSLKKKEDGFLPRLFTAIHELTKKNDVNANNADS